MNGTGTETEIPSQFKWVILLDIVEEEGRPPHRLNSNVQDLQELKKEIISKYYKEELEEASPHTIDINISYMDDQFKEFITLDSLEQLGPRPRLRVQRVSDQVIGLKKQQSFQKLKVPLEEVVAEMKDPVNGIKVKTRTLRLKSYASTFTGAEAVEWMISKLSLDKKEAIMMGSKLLKEYYIHHVTYASVPFEEKHLYQFQDLGDMSRRSHMPKFDCHEVMLGLLSTKNGVVMKDKKERFGLKKYKDCFTGVQAVDWLSANLNIRRNVAVRVGNKLLNHGFFHPVTDSYPFADAPFLYTTQGGKRPNYEFPAERIVKILQHLKAEDVFQGNKQDLEFVIDALTKGSGMNMFNVKVEDLLASAKVDRETSSLVLSHTGSSSQLPIISKAEMAKQAQQRNKFNTSPMLVIEHISDPILSILEQISDWNFDIFKLYELAENNTLPLLALAIFRKNGLVEKFGIDELKLRNLFLDISDGYNSTNPYHNAIHASDVLQTVNFFVTRGGFGQLLNDIEVLACFLAAAGHDINHPGYNNAFLINSRSPLALLYNDQSVLENHHCSCLFKAILKPENDILSGLSKEAYNELRRIIIKMILATDFGKHFDYVGQFKSSIANIDNLDVQKRETKDLYLEIAIKCADISHAAKKLETHLNWTNRVTEEFYKQGDEEKRLGMNVSPLMDRITGNVAKSQLGFINFMVSPLYVLWAEEFEDSKICYQILESNLEYWKSEIEKQQPKGQEKSEHSEKAT